MIAQEEESETDENENDTGNQQEKTRATDVRNARVRGTDLVSKREPNQNDTDDDTGDAEPFERAEP